MNSNTSGTIAATPELDRQRLGLVLVQLRHIAQALRGGTATVDADYAGALDDALRLLINARLSSAACPGNAHQLSEKVICKLLQLRTALGGAR